jgi:hypothetical protein
VGKVKNMKRSWIFIVCVLLSVGLAGCADAGADSAYYGDWSIKGVLADAPMGDFSEEDLSTITNVTLTFSKEEATCFGDQLDSLGQTVSEPEYSAVDVPKADFESMTGTSFDSLGIRGNHIAQVTVVNDPSYNDGIVFYVVSDDMLLANSLGTFFILNRIP